MNIFKYLCLCSNYMEMFLKLKYISKLVINILESRNVHKAKEEKNQ